MQPGHLDGHPGTKSQGPIPAPPPPHVYAWLEVNTQTQRVPSQVREYGGCQRGDHGQVQVRYQDIMGKDIIKSRAVSLWQKCRRECSFKCKITLFS